MFLSIVLEDSVVTYDFGGGQLQILHGAVEEGQVRFGAHRNHYFLLHHRVQAHLTVRLWVFIFYLQTQSLLVPEIHSAKIWTE